MIPKQAKGISGRFVTCLQNASSSSCCKIFSPHFISDTDMQSTLGTEFRSVSRLICNSGSGPSALGSHLYSLYIDILPERLVKRPVPANKRRNTEYKQKEERQEKRDRRVPALTTEIGQRDYEVQ